MSVRSRRDKPRPWVLYVAVGTALVAIALFMVVSRVVGNMRAAQASAVVLEQLSARKQTDLSESQASATALGEMPYEMVNGYAYVGILSIPAIDVRVPIARECDDDRLRISPCCLSGSYLANDLVICGEGYASHFGWLSSLGIRDEVQLEAVDGSVWRYVVSNVEREPLEQVDAVLHDWDLTLFTFNADDTCCVVRCVQKTS